MAMASQMRLEVGEWGYVGISVVVAHKYSGTNTVADGESDTDTRTHAHKGKVGGADDSIRCVCVPFFMRSIAIQNAYFKSSAKMNRSETTTTHRMGFHHQSDRQSIDLCSCTVGSFIEITILELLFLNILDSWIKLKLK